MIQESSKEIKQRLNLLFERLTNNEFSDDKLKEELKSILSQPKLEEKGYKNIISTLEENNQEINELKAHLLTKVFSKEKKNPISLKFKPSQTNNEEGKKIFILFTH